MIRTLVQLLASLTLAASLPQALAQNNVDFPQHPVRIIVPYGAGGSADILARAVSERLTTLWGQSVIVENKPGGIGTIGIMLAVNAKPDGYTLVSVPVSDLAVNPHLYKKRPFNVFKDLEPVSQVGSVPNMLIVNPALGVTDAAGLLALARQPGRTLTYGSPGVGSQAHLAAEAFASKHALTLNHIPYNSVAAAITDVAGGHVDLMFAQLPSALPFIQGKTVTLLGIAANQRSPLMPEAPTLSESTGEQYGDFISWSGLMAPAGTPLALREKIARDIQNVMNTTDLKQVLAGSGTVGIGSTPQELAATMRADYARYGHIISDLNLILD
ncbi:Bug family tripartite tricarboxylate transporter substrate binding protein [Alcaligenes sp. SDU_A2]|uniref:Bug family tripartite tricarboxylate transporter substrate binding protein n=1 Tax=Alcaligenes sp. SDU_A2 TaxID=3136634 RepID=UPI00311D5808